MKRDTVLVRVECDLRRLPINAKEAFFVSQLDGRITLEEASEIAGLEVDEGVRLAGRLTILGAVRDKSAHDEPEAGKPPVRFDPRAEEEPPNSTGRPDLLVDSVGRRADPRAEEQTPAAPPRPPKRTPRPMPRVESPAGRGPRRRSTRSMKAARIAPAPPPPAEEPCELHAVVQERIRALDAKLAAGVTHYDVLGVDRLADKKDVKRAYFALASELHPDRFFGKKLGPLRAILDRVFARLTEANEALATNAKRAAYDATLPPLPPTARAPEPEPAPAPAPAPPPKKPSIARRLSSRRMRRSQAILAVTPAPAKEPATAPKANSEPIPASAPPASATQDPERFKKLQAAARTAAGAERAQSMVRAAEDAIRSGDIVGAANNYRLALEMYDDPVIRQKLGAIDAHSRDLRHEKHVVRGRAAERSERWEDAAEAYVRANEARKEAAVAERAAYALVRSKGDLKSAAILAEQAVAFDGKNADYRVTLGEVYLASGFVVRAKEEAEAAVKLSPNFARAKALVNALRERS